MKPPKMYLLKRPENGVWYFRRPIPKRLQPFVHFGNKQTFTVSLKTQKLTEARARHHECWMESERILQEAEVRANAASGVGIECTRVQNAAVDSFKRRSLGEYSESEITAMVQRWFLAQQAEALEKCRALFNFADTSERKTELTALQGRLATLEKRTDGVDFEVYAVKRAILEDAGGMVEFLKKGSVVALDMKFTGLVREALVMLTRYSMSIVETGTPPSLEHVSPELSPRALSEASVKAKSITVNKLIEVFDKDARQRNVKPKTLDEFALVYAMLRDCVGGDTPIADVSRKQMRNLQELCMKLPARSGYFYPGKSFTEAVALGEKDKRPPIERATFNKRMALLARVFSFAVTEQLRPDNPATKLALEKKRREQGAKSLTIAQLRLIFTGPIFKEFAAIPSARFTPCHELGPHQFWTPLIGLFQGMRMGEILQLRVDDIDVEDGVNFLRIREVDETQSLKTEASRRNVPIHPMLEQLGFLTYVANMRKGREIELFPDASRGKTYGNRSHNYSKKFNRYLEAVGVKKDRDQCFHSLRHTFKDALERSEAPEMTIYRLGGWARPKNVADGYGGRVLPTLALHLAKVVYDGLDLSHLMPR